MQTRLRDRADLQALLQQQATESTGGISGAALAIRLDDADQMRDQLGHADYSSLMVALGDRLGRALRDQDLFCPLDPDGFGVALHPQRALDLAGVMAVAQRLQARLAAPLAVNGAALVPHVSVGVCFSPRAAMLNGLSMLEAAESAAVKALRAGPGGLTSYSVVDFPTTLTGDRIAALRQALEN
ncbi:MAG: diguanylate cyclase domain-containing protein, partial [Pararhodobacter sp.]